MKFVTKSFDLTKGEFTIQLDRPCRCHVGLVEWHMPSFDSKHYTDNVVDITCEQIDSTLDNPKRLLKRVVSSNVKWQHMTHFTPRFIDFKLIDSQDRFLTFKIRRFSGEDLVCPEKSTAHVVLAFKPINEKEDRWLCI